MILFSRFLMCKLFLDILASVNNVEALWGVLHTPLAGLDSMYDDIMRRIRSQVDANRNLAENTLSWVAYASRPLSVMELRHALSIPLRDQIDLFPLPDVDIVLSVCLGLLTVDDTSKAVLSREWLWYYCFLITPPHRILDRLHCSGVFRS
jgi:hypothetical protein